MILLISGHKTAMVDTTNFGTAHTVFTEVTKTDGLKPPSPLQNVEQKLHATTLCLKQSLDPRVRRRLLTEMRLLLAELDRLVLESTTSYSAHAKML